MLRHIVVKDTGRLFFWGILFPRAKNRSVENIFSFLIRIFLLHTEIWAFWFELVLVELKEEASSNGERIEF